MRRHTLRICLATLVVALALASAALALAPGLTEEPVVHSSRLEITPAIARAANGSDIVIWAESRNGRPGSYTPYLRKGGGAKLKLNVKGYGFAGGIDPPWVSYQQVVNGNSDIKLYRLDKRKRVATPAGVNTPKWEWGSTVSVPWLFFARGATNRKPGSLILFNLKTKKQRVVVHENSAGIAYFPGQANGNWAVWTKCGGSVCDGFVYNIATRKATKLAVPAGPPALGLYGMAVTRSGVVYTGRSSDACGEDATIVRYRGAGDPDTGTVLTSLPAGRDFAAGFARTNKNGSVDFLYDRRNCAAALSGDIYKITDPGETR